MVAWLSCGAAATASLSHVEAVVALLSCGAAATASLSHVEAVVALLSCGAAATASCGPHGCGDAATVAAGVAYHVGASDATPLFHKPPAWELPTPLPVPLASWLPPDIGVASHVGAAEATPVSWRPPITGGATGAGAADAAQSTNVELVTQLPAPLASWLPPVTGGAPGVGAADAAPVRPQPPNGELVTPVLPVKPVGGCGAASPLFHDDAASGAGAAGADD